MASVHFAFTNAMKGIAPTYGGQPVGETETDGGATTATLGNDQVCRAKAISGASYVRLGGDSTVAASAANGFYLAEGDVIDLHGSAGDKARQDNA